MTSILYYAVLMLIVSISPLAHYIAQHFAGGTLFCCCEVCLTDPANQNAQLFFIQAEITGALISCIMCIAASSFIVIQNLRQHKKILSYSKCLPLIGIFIVSLCWLINVSTISTFTEPYFSGGIATYITQFGDRTIMPFPHILMWFEFRWSLIIIAASLIVSAGRTIYLIVKKSVSHKHQA